MLPTPSTSSARVAAVTLVLALLLPLGCARPAPIAPRSAVWIAAHAEPMFDPDDAPDALRWSLERLLSRGLVERDSTGSVGPALADSIACSLDSLTWTFRLRADTRFTDGTPVTSEHLREALVGGLARGDHATRAWLLMAVRGVAKVRAGKPLPALGLATPDERTLVIRLERPDRRLLEKLAVPGVSTPWKHRSGSWADAIGVGPYRVLDAQAGHTLTLVRAGPVAGTRARVDTLRVRFVAGSARVGAALRARGTDLVWPVPAGLTSAALPAGWTLERHAARPARRLLLVLRADVPPLTHVDARLALAHALNREELVAALGEHGEPIRHWLPGARDAFEWPQLETALERASRRPREAPKGRRAHDVRPESYHVVIAYDDELTGAEIARTLQGQWARAGHYGELRALRGDAALAGPLAAAAAQVQLVESQGLLTGPEAELALLVMPLRGPAVGSYRTGWRTREFDRWVAEPEPAPGLDPDAVQAVLAQDRIVLPIAGLPWVMAVRDEGPNPAVHPSYGPDWSAPAERTPPARSR